ncbi:MAG: glycosyltransferase [Pyrinomonadaceae bacterium]
MNPSASEKQSLLILTPVFNDWESLRLLLAEFDDILLQNGLTASVLAVDDSSTVSLDEAEFTPESFKAIENVSILELSRNMGHQRAIALGFSYVHFNLECDAIVVVDGDGEDDPADVLRLIERCRETNFTKMVFARRAERSEGTVFKTFYVLYKFLYRILTGREIRSGNFSIVPYGLLSRLVCVSEIWNHYSVGVIKAKLPRVEIVTNRRERLAGESKMNFVSLVAHGLSAISVYADVVGIRLLISTMVLIVLSIIGILVTVAVRLTTDAAIPGWATTLTGILFLVALQASALSVFFVFIVLNSRNNISFLPVKDYLPFILRFRKVYPAK